MPRRGPLGDESMDGSESGVELGASYSSRFGTGNSIGSTDFPVMVNDELVVALRKAHLRWTWVERS